MLFFYRDIAAQAVDLKKSLLNWCLKTNDRANQTDVEAATSIEDSNPGTVEVEEITHEYFEEVPGSRA